MVIVNDGYMMLLDAIYFNGKKLGNISEDGIDWGGENAEYIKLNAAQVRTAPVKKIKKKDATNVLKLRLIELVPANCQSVMGGTVVGDTWHAPADSTTLEGPLKILTGTGQTIEVQRMTLDGVVRGKLGGSEALGVDCELEMLPAPNGGSPFLIAPTQPFISVNPSALTFVAVGESKTVGIEASGAFTIGNVPTGFSVNLEAGKIVVSAAANTGTAVKSGSIEFILNADNTKKATVTLSQAKP